MFCRNCGKELNEDDIYCPNCGACQIVNSTQNPEENVSKKSKLSSALLAIFVGQYGAHNFYLGNTKIALMQLIPSCSLILLEIMFGIFAFTNVLDPQICSYMFILFNSFYGLIKLWAIIDFILILSNKFVDKDNLIVKK